MKIRHLLLGSAAVLVTAGAAQAADLSIAEPVESVRVCDAFGAGFWYIPGTQTCLAIHGSVEFDANFHNNADVYGGHTAAWDFVTEAKLNVTAKSVTDYGDLVGYIGFKGDYDNKPSNANGTTWFLDDAWLSLGPIMAGNQFSTFNTAGIGGYTGFGHVYTDLTSTDQVRLTYAMGGFGLMFGIEDPRDRWGSDLSPTYTMPDLVAAITADQAKWSGKLAIAYNQIASPAPISAYGIAGVLEIKLDSIAAGDKLKLGGAYGNGSYTGFGAATATNNTWSAYAAFLHNWSPTVSSGFDISYPSNTGTSTAWQGGASLVWAPVAGFNAGVYGYYSQVNGASGVWSGYIGLVRSW